jgi:hypothetical protein
MTDRTPTTAAGRALLDSPKTFYDYPPCRLPSILAIEAEATAAEHERAVDACAKLVIAAKARATLKPEEPTDD